jgi:hypothetical protein
MRSSLFASVDVMEFQTTEAYSTLDLIKEKYNNNNNNYYYYYINTKVKSKIYTFINNTNNNNSIQYNSFIIYVPSQQPKGHLQTAQFRYR